MSQVSREKQLRVVLDQTLARLTPAEQAALDAQNQLRLFQESYGPEAASVGS